MHSPLPFKPDTTQKVSDRFMRDANGDIIMYFDGPLANALANRELVLAALKAYEGSV